jgi:serine/threonine protein kinase
MNHISTEILFEKFEIIDCLKKDGQTAVYLANHIFLSKKIILKTLNTDGLIDKTVLERFKREAKILASLDHPNIIKVLDFGTYNNFFYISFEYFAGKNLREVINGNNHTDDDKISLMIQLMKALNTAHQNGIIHRDIKPENILVNSTNELKIADFGLALVMNDNNITQSSTVVGTPSYMSPEQIRGEKTHQTDLFSAGLVCFELFTGRNPVLGKDVGATINNILNFNHDTILQDIEQLPVQVKEAVENLLHNNVAKRAKSAAEILKYLGQEVDNAVIKSNKKNKRYYVYSFIIIIALAGSVILYLNYFSGRNYKTLTIEIPQEAKVISANSSLDVNRDNSFVNNTDNKSLPENVKKTGAERVINLNKDKTLIKENPVSAVTGKISIDCFPWAEVFIDDKKIDITPIHDLSLVPGRHKIELYQPDYPPYRKNVTITAGKTEVININFENMAGYLNCEIYPWGEVYIDDKLIGTTPFTKPVALAPGKYKLTIKNANYSPVSKIITIKARQKISFSYNFQELTK